MLVHSSRPKLAFLVAGILAVEVPTRASQAPAVKLDVPAALSRRTSWSSARPSAACRQQFCNKPNIPTMRLMSSLDGCFLVA